jgi:hypothetical protein
VQDRQDRLALLVTLLVALLGDFHILIFLAEITRPRKHNAFYPTGPQKNMVATPASGEGFREE